MVRFFSTKGPETHFIETAVKSKTPIYFLNRNEVEALLSDFVIIDEHRSLPRTMAGIFFTELLLKKTLVNDLL